MLYFSGLTKMQIPFTLHTKILSSQILQAVYHDLCTTVQSFLSVVLLDYVQ